MYPSTVTEANQVDMAWIVANVDLDQARQNVLPYPPNNSRSPFQFEMPEVGTWQLDRFDELSVLVEIPVEEMKPSEGEWDMALRYPETQLYIQWQKDGLEPPPSFVVTNQHGELRTQNRRRWLAAREAGVKTLKCWYSPTHPEHCASPKWALKWIQER